MQMLNEWLNERQLDRKALTALANNEAAVLEYHQHVAYEVAVTLDDMVALLAGEPPQVFPSPLPPSPLPPPISCTCPRVSVCECAQARVCRRETEDQSSVTMSAPVGGGLSSHVQVRLEGSRVWQRARVERRARGAKVVWGGIEERVGH